MTASISFHQLDDDGPVVLERLAAHPDGIVVSYEGSEVARLIPLSAEERAWRDALLSEGVDPDEDNTSVERTEMRLTPAEPVLEAERASIEMAYAEPATEPLADPDDEPVIDPDEEPTPEPDRPYDPDPLEALVPVATPVEGERSNA